MANDQKPLNIAILDVNQYIKENNCLEVTSTFIHAPSSNAFAQDGLFSETIFGQLTSPRRLTQFGYITLNCQVLHPIIFQNLQALKRLYVEILSGKSYAIWNTEYKDFDRASEDEENADTGYSFFLKHFFEIEFNKNASLKRNDKIEIINKYKDRLLLDKVLCIPAGLREMREEDGRKEKDSINSLYVTLMNNVRAMPITGGSKPIFDTIHYAIQRKVNELHLYITDMVKGKKAFFEGKYGARSIAQGTRNVITASSMECSSPESPQYHKVDETKIPLFQCAKGFSSLVAYQIKHFFYSPILDMTSDQIPVIDPNDYQIKYMPIDETEKDKLLGTEGIMKFIDLFQDADFRFKPVSVTSSNKNKYYLYLVYDMDDKIFIFRDINGLKQKLEEKQQAFDPSKLRSLTNCELLYIATYFASIEKYGTVTRYPIEDEQSIYISKVHLMSTIPGRVVTLLDTLDDGNYGTVLPEYPVIGNTLIDAMLLHPTRLKALKADFDRLITVASRGDSRRIRK